MIKYLTHSQINKEKWDACIEASPQRIVYGLSWYLDVVAPLWAALVQEDQEQYYAVMPLPEAYKLGIKYVFQPFFCPQLGVFSRVPINLNDFVAVLAKQYRFIRNYCCNTQNNETTPANSAFKVISCFTHHLNLNQYYETIHNQYSRDRKLNLARAKKAGLTIIQSTEIKLLIQLFREDAEFRIYGGVLPETYHMLERLYAQLQQRSLATLFYTQTSEGVIDSGCLFITYANKIIYIFNAASKAGRRRNGRSLIIDSVIRQHASQPVIFDFESPTAVASIIRVYQGFGAEAVPYTALFLNKLPAPIKFIKEARRLFYQRFLTPLRTGTK